MKGITDLRDESSREGMRIVIDVRRDVSASVVLNNLYKMTALQTSFGFNMLAIEKGVNFLSLKRILENYVEHQKKSLLAGRFLTKTKQKHGRIF